MPPFSPRASAAWNSSPCSPWWLAVAGASTRWLLPRLIVAAPRDAAQSAWLARLWERVATLPRPRWLPALLTVLALGVLWAAPGPFWENNLAALTPVPEALLRRDGELRAELGAPDVRYLLVLEGADAEAVLQASERLGSALAPLRERGALAGYELPSTWLPASPPSARARPRCRRPRCRCARRWTRHSPTCRSSPTPSPPSSPTWRPHARCRRWIRHASSTARSACA